MLKCWYVTDEALEEWVNKFIGHCYFVLWSKELFKKSMQTAEYGRVWKTEQQKMQLVLASSAPFGRRDLRFCIYTVNIFIVQTV